jgi:FecR protein
MLFNRSVKRTVRSKSGLIAMLFLLAGIIFYLTAQSTFAQSTLPVRVDRWLEVEQLSGTVTFQRNKTSQAAKVGTRLEAIGDTLSTDRASSATLSVDTGVGTVAVAENTTLRVQELETLPSGGKITTLNITGGQARLELRPFTNPDSRLEIETPAGISGVRGTIFGVSVQPNGITGVATLEGRVVTAAQGQSVSVDAGQQSLVVPGEPPTPPTPLQENTAFDLVAINRIDRRTVEIVGQIDGVNLLVVEDEVRDVERDGRFTIRTADDRPVRATVITPLGKRQDYEITIP